MKTKKLLAVLLAFVMIFSSISAVANGTEEDDTGNGATNVAKIGDVEYATLAEAITNANDNDEITLISDIEATEAITIGKAITLDLNGKTITSTNAGYARFRKLDIKAPVTIKNGTLNNTWVSTTKNITMTGVNITIVDDPTHTGPTVNALYLERGTIEAKLTNCNLSVTSTRGSANAAIFINWQAENSTIEVTGGSLTTAFNRGNSGYASGAIATTTDNITLTLNGVDVVYQDNATSYAALNFGSPGGTLTVNGGSVTATSYDGTESRNALRTVWNKSATVNVEGDAVINGRISFGKKGATFTKINIKGGTFTDEDLINVTSEESDPVACLWVTGGKFADSAVNRESLTAAGVTFTEEGGYLNGVDTSARIAKVGEIYYDNFADAVAAAGATEDKEIVIASNVETDIETIRGFVVKTEGARAKLAVSVDAGAVKEQIASVFDAVAFENASLVELVCDTEVVASFADITVRDGAIVSGCVSQNAMEKAGYYYHPTLLPIAQGSAYMNDTTVAPENLGRHRIVEYGAGTKYIIGVELSHNGVSYYRVYQKLDDAVGFAANNDNENTQINDTIKLFDNVTDIAGYYGGGETYYVSNVGTNVDYATFTLDLNGFTWSSEKKSDDLVYMLAIVANNANVTVKNGTIKGTHAIYGITTNGMFKNVTLNIEDVDIYVPNGSGAYLPASGKATFSNTNIEAGTVGIQTCASDVVIDNCSIKVDGEDRSSEKTNGDGLIPDGSAISIVHRPGYSAIPSCEVSGGKFESKGDVKSIRAYKWESLTLSDWNVEETGKKAAVITGGEFDTDVTEFCTDGYYWNEATQTVHKSSGQIENSKSVPGVTFTADEETVKNAIVDFDPKATYEIMVENVTNKKDKEAASVIKVDDKDYLFYDIDFVTKKDGKEEKTVFNGTDEIEIRIELEHEIEEGTSVVVYHLLGDGTRETIAPEKIEIIDNKTIKFMTTSFSSYMVEYNAKSLTETEIADGVVAKLVKRNDRTYDIVVESADAVKKINKLSAADLKFKLTQGTSGAVNYTITPAAAINLIEGENGRFGFNFDGLNVHCATGKSIILGSVVFEGYCEGAIFEYDTDADTSVVHTTKISDSIVNTFAKNAGLTYADSSVVLNLEPLKKELIVNISFPNAVRDNASAYQNMKMTIKGSNYEEEIIFGTDAQKMGFPGNEYSVTRSLVENQRYTVTVSGAGYRTVSYSVLLDNDKKLNFWNNVKDNAEVIEVGAAAATAKEATFLAGDIVKDNKINIYDLSAVVSYFGTETDVSAVSTYAKYDLNRDGVIDSKDIAYVLVSWGK